MHRTMRFMVGLFILAFVLCFSPGENTLVYAQTAVPTPQKVIAINTIVIPEGEDCAGQGADLRLEVWNVGAAGGAQYSGATMTATGLGGECGKPGTELKTNYYEGTFSGGPNGKVTLVQLFSEEQKKVLNPDYIEKVYVLHFVDGVRVTGEFRGEFIVQNPEAFIGAEPPTVTPTPAKGCSPIVGGLSGLKPGDILSPAVQFVDPEGKPIAPLSAVWYINGQATSSIIWNGQAVSLDLQYTCPDNSAHNQGYSVPAYTGGVTAVAPPPAQPDNPPVAPPSNSSSLPGGSIPGWILIPIAAVGGIVAVAAVVGGALVINGIRKPAPAVPAPRPAPYKTAPVSAPSAQAPPAPPTQTAPVPAIPLQTPPPAPTPAAPEPAVQTGPAVELPPLPPEPAPAQPPAQSAQTKAEPVEEGDLPKSPFEAAKDAADQYVKELEQSGKAFETLKNQLENVNLPPETREAIKRQIQSFTDTTEKIKNLLDTVSGNVVDLSDFRDKVKSLNQTMKDLAQTHAQTLKDLKDLPPGPAHAFADLAVVIDAAGRGAEALVNKLPGGEKVSKAFEIKESVQEGIKGMGKAVKVWNTSNTEAKNLSDGGKNPVPGYDPEKGYTDEIIKIHNEAVKNQPPGPIDKIKKWLDWLTGEKHVDPSQIQFR